MIKEDAGAEIVCRYWNKKYDVPSDDLGRLLEHATKE